MSGTTGFAISFWFRSLDTPVDLIDPIFSHGDYSSLSEAFILLSLAETNNKLNGLLQAVYKPGTDEAQPSVLFSDGQVSC